MTPEQFDILIQTLKICAGANFVSLVAIAFMIGFNRPS